MYFSILRIFAVKMENIFIIAAVISIIFLIVKFIEMRYIEKDSKPLKLLIRDSLLVYFSVVSGYFIMEQLKPVMQNGDVLNGGGGTTPVFTNNPEFYSTFSKRWSQKFCTTFLKSGIFAQLFLKVAIFTPFLI